jgi:hypothetical protein
MSRPTPPGQTPAALASEWTNRSRVLIDTIEPLEPRRHLSVTLVKGGYHNFAPSNDSRIVYVSSSSGDDKNDGHDMRHPVKTIARASKLVRSGKPDQVLLKAGDTFKGGIVRWTASGRSSQEMMVIGAYGRGARPLVLSGMNDGFSVVGGTAPPVRHVAVVGIEFFADRYDGSNASPTGIRLQRQGSDFLVEDCYVHGYKDNVVVGAPDAPINAVRLVRNVVADAYSVSVGHSQGLYVSGTVRDVWLEGNVFDANGWNPSAGAGDNVFNHNAYFQTGVANVTVENNFFTRGSLHGLMLRSGGIVQNNVFDGNGVGLMVGGEGRSTVTGNLFMRSRDLTNTPSGVGVNVEGGGRTTVADNVFAHDASGNPANASGIAIKGSAAHVQVTSNVLFNWRRAIRNEAAGATSITYNQVQTTLDDRVLVDHRTTTDTSVHTYDRNVYYSPRKTNQWFAIRGAVRSDGTWKKALGEWDMRDEQVDYPDPWRTLTTYGKEIAGSKLSLKTLMARFRGIRRGNADNANYSASWVIAYVRRGFGLRATPSFATKGEPPFNPDKSYRKSKESALLATMASRGSMPAGGLFAQTSLSATTIRDDVLVGGPRQSLV